MSKSRPGSSSANRRKRRRLIVMDGPRCYLCGEIFMEEDLQLEHKIPKSRGGSDNILNLALACDPCNQDKGNMTPEEYYRYKMNTRNVKAEDVQFRTAEESRLEQPLSDVWPLVDDINPLADHDRD